MPERSVETEIAVVGAGIAGLTAASTLAREGVDVVVLEARDRVGGRVWNTEIGGEANELGGQWVAPYQSEMHALLEELGIELFPSFREGEHVYIDPSGKAHRYEGHDAPLGAASERAFAEAEAKLDALAEELDPEAPWAHPDAAELDAITFEAWLRREVADEMAQDLLRSWLAGGFLAKPAHTFSLLQGLWMIAGAGGTYELFEPDQCLACRVVGGSQLIPIRLAERLGDRVVLDAPARDIRWSDGGRRGRHRGRCRCGASGDRRGAAEPDQRDPLSARAARLAPAHGAGPLAGQHQQDPRRLRATVLARGRALRTGVRALRARPRALRQLAAVGDRRRPDHVPRGRERRARRAPERRRPPRRGARGDGEVRRPAARCEPVDFIETDWSAQEWTRGAYGTSFGVGGLTRFGEDLRRSIGPIHWACTDIAGVGHIHMEGAVRSGQRAATPASPPRRPEDSKGGRRRR